MCSANLLSDFCAEKSSLKSNAAVPPTVLPAMANAESEGTGSSANQSRLSALQEAAEAGDYGGFVQSILGAG